MQIMVVSKEIQDLQLILSDPDNEGRRNVWNVGTRLPNYTVSYPRLQQYSSLLAGSLQTCYSSI